MKLFAQLCAAGLIAIGAGVLVGLATLWLSGWLT